MSSENPQQYSVVKENGERVVPATRRPDGTWRKERRVKDGYTPQDEQPLFQTKAIMARQGVPLCPGLDDAEVVARMKAVKKPKEQKLAQLKEKPASVSKTSEKSIPKDLPQATSQETAEEDPQAMLEKDMRKLKKKIRECDLLVDKHKNGDPLTTQEEEKLSKLTLWNEELHCLEAGLSGLNLK
ncbi:hypothetical protein CEUSTIGMA_g9446.t1 [Chlamydomonas eustigma]|uniref:WIBG Mago-binding domain-containing protein n=1 Tax=Chlamydomonas eustigma TaxID=1157962 RepID=A0A250XG12_9CHLO|nr:hypothetical protein CEUSTIGMA_g9446.t1 [Chlamydomonas eustigma]|eukprot:GAX82018.1 hypothetical protein CEUSTIGMA_g9446.t1 [Chlamydomonas eustigma]